MVGKTGLIAHGVGGGRVVGLIGIMALLTVLLWAGGVEAGDKDKGNIHIYSSEVHGDKGYLGVKMQELDDNLREGLDIKVKTGVLINEVIEGSPAEAAGIEDGDVVIEFNGEKVESPAALRDLVAKTEAGETVKVKVFRDNRIKTYDVTIGDWPKEFSWNVVAPEHMVWFDKGKDFLLSSFGRGRLGVHVTELNEDLASYFDANEGEGVLVTDVVEKSTAEEMGIKAGDIIVKVGAEDVGSKDELIDAVGEVDPGDPIEVTVIRKNKKVTLEGEMQETAAATYVRSLKSYPRQLRMHDVYKLSDDELDELKTEMEALKKEMEEMREQLKKVERKTR